METFIPNFKGSSLAGYGLEIKEGKHVSTPQGEFVELSHGQEYSLDILNFNTHRCRFNLNIDGYDQGSWQIGPQCTGNIERPAEVPKKFTFYRVKYAPKSSGITAGRSENGVVTCSFLPEMGAHTVDIVLSSPCSIPVVNPAKFSMFEKHSTKDFADKTKEILSSKYKVPDTSEYDLIRWLSGKPNCTMKDFLDLTGDKDSFIMCDGYCEQEMYYIDCLPKIRSLSLKYKESVFNLNLLSAPKMKDVFQLIEKLHLSSFCLATTKGRIFCLSQWEKMVETDHIYYLLRKAEIVDAAKEGKLEIEVFDERPDSGLTFEVYVKTLTGKSIPLLVTDDTSTMEMKMMIQMKEGIPPDQQRLIASGLQLEDELEVRDYPGIREEKVMHLVLRLRGGGMHPNLKVKAGDVCFESDTPEKKTLNAPDSNWVSGATTLGEASQQKFATTAAIRIDRSKETKLILRLVARGDEMVVVPQFDEVPCTPLSTAIPPPMQD